jgi:type VI secretion system protein VasI
MTQTMLRLGGAFFISALLCGSSPVLAQAAGTPDAKAIALCAGITSDLKRLTCYDDLSRQIAGPPAAAAADSNKPAAAQAPVSAGSQAPAAQPPAGQTSAATDSTDTGAWTRNDETDGLDNSKIVIFSLTADSGNVGLIGKPGLKRPPLLILRCKEHQAQVFVSFDLPVTGSGEDVPVQYRIGASPPASMDLARSEDETSFGDWTTASAAPLIEKLETGQDFFVRAKSGNGRTSEALFKLAGIDAAVKPIREACPW